MREWVYVNGNNNDNRYILGEAGKKVVFCIGINPSYAEPPTIGKLDRTIQKVQAISNGNAFDGWIMINIYPKRDTKFTDLPLEMDEKAHEENLKFISRILDDFDNINVWAAFGNHIYHRTYFKECLLDIYNLLQKKNPKWLSVGINKSGAPKHPLYQKNNSELIEFDMKSFVESF